MVRPPSVRATFAPAKRDGVTTAYLCLALGLQMSIAELCSLIISLPLTPGASFHHRRGSAFRSGPTPVGAQASLEIVVEKGHRPLFILTDTMTYLPRFIRWHPGTGFDLVCRRIHQEISTMAIRKDSIKSLSPPDVSTSACQILPLGTALFDHMTQQSWEDGSERPTTTLSISYGDGRFLGCVRDRATARIAYLSGDTLSELLDAIQQALESEQMVWRKDPFAKPLQGKGIKKS